MKTVLLVFLLGFSTPVFANSVVTLENGTLKARLDQADSKLFFSSLNTGDQITPARIVRYYMTGDQVFEIQCSQTRDGKESYFCFFITSIETESTPTKVSKVGKIREITLSGADAQSLYGKLLFKDIPSAGRNVRAFESRDHVLKVDCIELLYSGKTYTCAISIDESH